MEDVKSRSSSASSAIDSRANAKQSNEFDFQSIVVGAGAAGCPPAANLAKKGRTLFFERVKPYEKKAENRSICLNKAVKWNRTESGSWAACANVLGGGSAVNAGVFIKETSVGRFFKEYNFLKRDQVQKAYAEVSEKVSNERDPLGGSKIP